MEIRNYMNAMRMILTKKNLINLTKPISNIKCKDKKSLFNKLFSLNGTKVLSGYLDFNSYFDIYAEINNGQNHVINLSPIMKDIFAINNNAKYLKKDVTYSLNFFVDHLIKLEPGFNAEIVITNGQNTTIISSDKPIN